MICCSPKRPQCLVWDSFYEVFQDVKMLTPSQRWLFNSFASLYVQNYLQINRGVTSPAYLVAVLLVWAALDMQKWRLEQKLHCILNKVLQTKILDNYLTRTIYNSALDPPFCGEDNSIAPSTTLIGSVMGNKIPKQGERNLIDEGWVQMVSRESVRVTIK